MLEFFFYKSLGPSADTKNVVSGENLKRTTVTVFIFVFILVIIINQILELRVKRDIISIFFFLFSASFYRDRGEKSGVSKISCWKSRRLYFGN